jgi:hypothetical protein
MLFKCRAASAAGFTKEMPIRIKVEEEVDGPVYVAWLNTPSAIETLNVTRRSGPIRSYVE